MRTCRGCGAEKPLEQFGRSRTSRGGYRNHCKPCLAETARGYIQARFEHHSRVLRERQLRLSYGFSSEQYDALLTAQQGVCAICGGSDPGRAMGGQRKYFAIDHNHLTGHVRGLLCNRCNRFIGLMNDDPDLLARAAAYLATGRSGYG